MAYYGGRLSERQPISLGAVVQVDEYNYDPLRYPGAQGSTALNAGAAPFRIDRLRNSMLRAWGGLMTISGSSNWCSLPSAGGTAYLRHPVIRLRAGRAPAQNAAAKHNGLYGTQSPSVFIPGVYVPPVVRSG